jgi:hypothetical protein
MKAQWPLNNFMQGWNFIPALLDIMDGLFLCGTIFTSPTLVLPINLLGGLPKGLEDFCWWALCMGCQKVTPL